MVCGHVWQVLTLVPTAPSRLVPVVAGGIPHRLHDRDTQCRYMRGALALAEAPAAAAVREGILAAAAEHLLSLDAEIRWQDIAAAATGAHLCPRVLSSDILGCLLALPTPSGTLLASGSRSVHG